MEVEEEVNVLDIQYGASGGKEKFILSIFVLLSLHGQYLHTQYFSPASAPSFFFRQDDALIKTLILNMHPPLVKIPMPLSPPRK